MSGWTRSMLAKYHCSECADKRKSSPCYTSGICPHAEQMEEFRNLNESCELEMYGVRKKVKNVETGDVYRSVSAAERAVGANRGKLGKELNNPNRTVKGYHWVTA